MNSPSPGARALDCGDRSPAQARAPEHDPGTASAEGAVTPSATSSKLVIILRHGVVEAIAAHASMLENLDVVVIDHDVEDDMEGVESAEAEGLVYSQDLRVPSAPTFTNHYRHDDCPVQPGVEWDDTWSCACNDRCPACNAEIEPFASEVST